jgi:hypothetical protein
MARKRIMPARHYRPRNDPIRAIAERGEPALRADIAGALRHLKMIVPVKAVADELKHGRTRAAIDKIDFTHFAQILKEPFQGIGKIFEQAADVGAKRITHDFVSRGRKIKYRKALRPQLSKTLRTHGIAKDIGDAFVFDRFDEDTQAELRDLQDDLIKELTDAARASVERTVLDGVRAGDDFDTIATGIRDTISLTDRQAQAVTNYRRMLEDLDSGALDRALRNSDYDDRISDAIDSGEFLSDGSIERMVRDYAENYLAYRAVTIARTESLRASNVGLRNAYTQAVNRGALPAEAITREWLIDLDERTCEICISIIEANPNGIGLDESFDSDDGPVDDPPVHPNCRCSVQYVTDLDKVPDEPASDETDDETTDDDETEEA